MVLVGQNATLSKVPKIAKVSSLTLRPLLENGRLQYEDAPLVRAAKHGRVCVA